VAQSAKSAIRGSRSRPRELELAPELALGAPLFLGDGRQGEEYGAVGEIGSASSMPFSRIGRAASNSTSSSSV
jgi:hypothetical protein